MKDGEIGDGQEEKNDSEATSPRQAFQQMVQEWSWGAEPGLEQFQEAIHELMQEQYSTLSQENCQTQYFLRMKQRLAIMERYFVSLARKGIGSQRHSSTAPNAAGSSKKRTIPAPSV